MAVNDERMLPRRIRKMYQMEDLLQAEQLLMGIIERIISEMIYEASLVISETVTPEFLRRLVKDIFKLECTIVEYQEDLTVKIRLHIEVQEPAEPIAMIEKTNSYIPAHLKVLYEYVSKQYLKGVYYVAQPRADYIRLSVPHSPMDSKLRMAVHTYVAIPALEYVELRYPVKEV